MRPVAVLVDCAGVIDVIVTVPPVVRGATHQSPFAYCPQGYGLSKVNTMLFTASDGAGYVIVPHVAKLVTAPNVAPTLVAPLTVVLHVPVPEHAPVQPLNVYPAFGVAVRVTEVPEVYEYEQVAPQEIPEGDDVIVPLPPLVTVSEYVVTGIAEKVTLRVCVACTLVKVTGFVVVAVPSTVMVSIW